MRIITDSRENKNQKILEKFSKNDIPFKVKKLEFGDYSIENYENEIVIERKGSLTELAGNFTKGRERFEAEFIRAREAGAKVYLLIEDAKGRDKIKLRVEMDKEGVEESIKHKKTWRSNFRGNSMVGSIVKWMEKYNFKILFCSKAQSGDKIIEIFNNFLQNKDI